MQFKGFRIGLGAVLLGPMVVGCATTGLFGFPADEGNVEAGRQAFLDHQCHQCHSIAGERLPPLAGADRPILELGGPTTVVRTYADLTTSVINPGHSISERYYAQELLSTRVPVGSPMPRPNLDTMTVRQLIDIVAFLDARYQVLVEDYE